MYIQFWTRLVEQPKDFRLRISYAGGILFLVCFFLISILEKMGKAENWAAAGAILGVVLAFIGWMLRGFKTPRPRITEIEILISSDEIRVGDQCFRVAEVGYLDFLVNSYQGMRGPKFRWRRIVLRGTDNKLMFSADGKQHSFRFYLEDEMAMRRLGMLFREFYGRGLPFRERNRGGRTFLFEQVMDRRAFERAKQREGYLQSDGVSS
jgi:hypothetical protein